MKQDMAGYSFDEWKEIKKEFENNFKVYTKYNQSFGDLIGEIIKGESEKEFMIKTGLGVGMLYRLRNQVNEKDIPNRCTLISVCVGYDLDLMMAQALLHSLGLDFNCYSQTDYAYSFLLTRCRGKDIDECNEILKDLGIEEKYWLGYHPRKKDKR